VSRAHELFPTTSQTKCIFLNRQFPGEDPCHKHVKWLAGDLRRDQPGFGGRSSQCSINRLGKRKDQGSIGASGGITQGFENADHVFDIDPRGFPQPSGEEMHDPHVLPGDA
jgi:hypothetical protein